VYVSLPPECFNSPYRDNDFLSLISASCFIVITL
jgi:hypothetical protein